MCVYKGTTTPADTGKTLVLSETHKKILRLLANDVTNVADISGELNLKRHTVRARITELRKMTFEIKSITKDGMNGYELIL